MGKGSFQCPFYTQGLVNPKSRLDSSLTAMCPEIPSQSGRCRKDVFTCPMRVDTWHLNLFHLRFCDSLVVIFVQKLRRHLVSILQRCTSCTSTYVCLYIFLQSDISTCLSMVLTKPTCSLRQFSSCTCVCIFLKQLKKTFFCSLLFLNILCEYLMLVQIDLLLFLILCNIP